MNPLELLLSRKSHNKLVAPAPSDEQLNILFKAALRAPDHALLKPWYYRVYQEDSLATLGAKMAEAALKLDASISEEKLDKIRNKPLRAPMVVVASVKVKEHPKVPEIEQVLSGGASVQNLLMAAHFQGIGAMWRTGSLAFNLHLHSLLGFEKNEILTGFIYLGTEQGEKRAAKLLNIDDFVTRFS
ncbi:nitroreductase family protein [Aliikangiella sp. IMCC44359]|uniref:nitroreductase family protein n=1 Tax=Aliikangiella sp. IMCC44359 TaxID=3459125 RepID=UPI00403A8548